MRTCIKCGKILADGIVFCPACGTRQYISLKNSVTKDDKLMEIGQCRVYRLGFSGNVCTFRLYASRIEITESGGNVLLNTGYDQIASVAPYHPFLEDKAGISLTTWQKGKIWQTVRAKIPELSLVFPPECKDSIPYIISLIKDFSGEKS